MKTAQLQLMGRFVADYNGGEPDDYEDEIDTTRDALNRYDGTGWFEAEGRIDAQGYGIPARYFERVRASKGQPACSVWIMDFGEFRAVCQM